MAFLWLQKQERSKILTRSRKHRTSNFCTRVRKFPHQIKNVNFKQLFLKKPLAFLYNESRCYLDIVNKRYHLFSSGFIIISTLPKYVSAVTGLGLLIEYNNNPDNRKT